MIVDVITEKKKTITYFYQQEKTDRLPYERACDKWYFISFFPKYHFLRTSEEDSKRKFLAQTYHIKRSLILYWLCVIEGVVTWDSSPIVRFAVECTKKITQNNWPKDVFLLHKIERNAESNIKHILSVFSQFYKRKKSVFLKMFIETKGQLTIVGHCVVYLDFAYAFLLNRQLTYIEGKQ